MVSIVTCNKMVAGLVLLLVFMALGSELCILIENCGFNNLICKKNEDFSVITDSSRAYL